MIITHGLEKTGVKEYMFGLPISRTEKLIRCFFGMMVVFIFVFLGSCDSQLEQISTKEVATLQSTAVGLDPPDEDRRTTMIPVITNDSNATSQNLPQQTLPVQAPTSPSDIDKFDKLVGIGELWVVIYTDDLFKETEYLVINFNQGSTYQREAPPYGCSKIPLSNTLQVVCKNNDHPYYLFDLITTQIQELPIEKNVHMVWSQPSSPNVLFWGEEKGTNQWMIYAYHFDEPRIEQLTEYPIQGLEQVPIILSDLKHLVTVMDNKVVEIDMDTGDMVNLLNQPLKVTRNIGLSPNNTQLVYGVTDLEQEIGEQANYVYLLNLENNQQSLLSTPTTSHRSYNEMGWPVWAHNSKKVVVLSGNAICVIDIQGPNERCEILSVPDYSTNYDIDWVTWSPDDNNLAFVEYPDGLPGNLFILSMRDHLIHNVLEIKNIGGLFWR